jgi:hypothetical protein
MSIAPELKSRSDGKVAFTEYMEKMIVVFGSPKIKPLKNPHSKMLNFFS